MSDNPMDVIMQGLTKINSVKDTSLFNGEGFRQVLSVWKQAEKLAEQENEKSGNPFFSIGLASGVDAFFMTEWGRRVEEDDEFGERWHTVSPGKVNQIWETISEIGEYKQMYDPRVKNELKIALSKII